MAAENYRATLRALPVQIIEMGQDVILKRGCAEIKIGGDEAKEAVRHVFAFAGRHGGASIAEICDHLPMSKRMAVEQLVEHLVARRVLVPVDCNNGSSETTENPQDIFYWHFGSSATDVAHRLNSRKLAVLGFNHVALYLCAALRQSGWTNFHLVDDPRLRNDRLLEDAGSAYLRQEYSTLAQVEDVNDWTGTFDSREIDSIVVTSDFGNALALREWNRFAIERKCHFVPVSLHNLIGYFGPLTIPGETACYECLTLRQNSHMQDPSLQRASEELGFEGQAVIGSHETMASILGQISAFELLKAYSGVMPARKIGTLIEVNLLATQLTSRRVLKIPRCPVCAPLKYHSFSAIADESRSKRRPPRT
jgi:thiazole/oxazole-forming peptide maturase SagC family component